MININNGILLKIWDDKTMHKQGFGVRECPIYLGDDCTVHI